MPWPVRVMLCGLPDALSATVIAPCRFPVVVGTNVTLIVQCDPAATGEPQSSISWKLTATVMLVIFSAAAPELVTVMAWAGLAPPGASSGKNRLVADRVTAGDPDGIERPPQPVSRAGRSTRTRLCVNCKRLGLILLFPCPSPGISIDSPPDAISEAGTSRSTRDLICRSLRARLLITRYLGRSVRRAIDFITDPPKETHEPEASDVYGFPTGVNTRPPAKPDLGVRKCGTGPSRGRSIRRTEFVGLPT